MIKLNIQMDIDQALSKLARIPDEVESKALPRALNKVAEQAKVQASREIRDAGYKIKASDIKRALSIKKANRSQLVTVVKASGRPIALVKYGARQTKTGVTVAVKGGRKLIQGAFIAVMPNGHAGVFVRGTRGSRGNITGRRVKYTNELGQKNTSQLPISELYGPSIPSAFSNQVVITTLLNTARDRFRRIFEHELEFLSLKR